LSMKASLGKNPTPPPDETKDAAEVIEQLLVKIKKLENRLISIDGKNKDQGFYNQLPWTCVVEMVEKQQKEINGNKGSPPEVASLVLSENGLGIYWK
jgi:hypothetical protein